MFGINLPALPDLQKLLQTLELLDQVLVNWVETKKTENITALVRFIIKYV